MRAVWCVARAAVRRRRLQSFVLGVVVLVSTATVVVALGMMASVSGTFEQAYDAAKGAHVVAEFDGSRTTAAQLARTAQVTGVEATAGPYPEAVLHGAAEQGGPFARSGVLTVVGRDRPDTAVDSMKVFSGRWVEGPGEIVLDAPQGFGGARLIDGDVHVLAPGGVDLKVVGYATSVSQSADGWVTPAEARALGAGSNQMMYRFRDAGSDTALKADMAAVTAGLPSGSLTATSSYLTIGSRLAAGPNRYVPLLTAFGILGLVVSVLIVGNVVSGAVVAGYRHIGILKALGFTPDQVTAVYLVMVTLPAALGCLVGAGVGSVVGTDLVQGAFWGVHGNYLVSGRASVPGWILPLVLLGMPALTVVSALIPAVRARRLPAAVAISAAGVQRTGRALAAQRRLGGSRLPRPVSLGLGWPFARPGRTALTLSTVVVGVTAATLAIGLSASVLGFNRAQNQQDRVQVTVAVDNPASPQHPPAPVHTDEQLFALLRALPGVARVSAQASVRTRMAGSADTVDLGVATGDTAALHPDLVRGRWTNGPGEVVADSEFWHQHRLSLGETVVLLDTAGRQVRETVVGEQMDGTDLTSTDWDRFIGLNPTHRATSFSVGLTKGADPSGCAAAARRVDPGLQPSVNAGVGSVEQSMIGTASTLTALLVAVAGLGVFNAVVLSTRERRRDIGVLKSIGMTPRQVIAMVVAAMGALGAVGGLLGVPLGVLAHRIVIPVTGHSIGRDLPASLLDVWNWPLLALLVLSGAALAVLGAFLPSVRASRAPAAQVLRTE
ncbi:ABC transporter permease [Streptacidiphilus carbonis]|uniref:ABC transporter permease n=1 Tax=Streptacidiphilus carbonis TaxID=105422 RepID=UPI0005A939D7|nr:ABC transporter permease [Streptacidiphilus carbonis]